LNKLKNLVQLNYNKEQQNSQSRELFHKMLIVLEGNLLFRVKL